jgi:hypothetical protein
LGIGLYNYSFIANWRGFLATYHFIQAGKTLESPAPIDFVLIYFASRGIV